VSDDELALIEVLKYYRKVEEEIGSANQKLDEMKLAVHRHQSVIDDLIDQLPPIRQTECRHRVGTSIGAAGLQPSNQTFVMNNVCPYESAIDARLKKLLSARALAQQLYEQIAVASKRRTKLIRLASNLAEDISPERHELYAPRLSEFNLAKVTARAESQLSYADVVEIISRTDHSKAWTAEDISIYLPGASKKSLYNALQYAVRMGKVERVSHGRYRMKELGVTFETRDEIGMPESEDN
jgi:hypothetical protein